MIVGEKPSSSVTRVEEDGKLNQIIVDIAHWGRCWSVKPSILSDSRRTARWESLGESGIFNRTVTGKMQPAS